MKSYFDLPADAVAFLRERRTLQYDAAKTEAGAVTLHPLADLKLGQVWIGTDEKDDPHHDEDGYYTVPAVSLTATCSGYDPAYILLWLPEEKKFGTWDCDHWTLSVFESATWQDIERSPAIYIDAQWRARSPVVTRFKPWPRYELKLGRPF